VPAFSTDLIIDAGRIYQLPRANFAPWGGFLLGIHKESTMKKNQLADFLVAMVFERNGYGSMAELIARIEQAKALPEDTHWRSRKAAFNTIAEIAPMRKGQPWDKAFLCLTYADFPVFVAHWTQCHNTFEKLGTVDQFKINRRPFKLTDDGFVVNGKICFDMVLAEGLFDAQRHNVEAKTNDRFDQVLTQSEAAFGEIVDERRYQSLIEIFINIIVKACCSAV
jgi:hypothetical protein